jgi:hypothetical protein
MFYVIPNSMKYRKDLLERASAYEYSRLVWTPCWMFSSSRCISVPNWVVFPVDTAPYALLCLMRTNCSCSFLWFIDVRSVAVCMLWDTNTLAVLPCAHICFLSCDFITFQTPFSFVFWQTLAPHIHLFCLYPYLKLLLVMSLIDFLQCKTSLLIFWRICFSSWKLHQNDCCHENGTENMVG